MISDANWGGGGVGTYQALAAIYRDVTGVPGEAAINTITSMVLEWGRGGLLIAIVLLLQLLVSLFRGALSRGRDSFYAAAAAACLVTAFCEAFCDSSFTDINGSNNRRHCRWIGTIADHRTSHQLGTETDNDMPPFGPQKPPGPPSVTIDVDRRS